MNYIEMSKICEYCREVNNASCIGCDWCKSCKKLDKNKGSVSTTLKLGDDNDE